MDTDKMLDDPIFYQGRTPKQLKDNYKITFWSMIAFIILLIVLQVYQLIIL